MLWPDFWIFSIFFFVFLILLTFQRGQPKPSSSESLASTIVQDNGGPGLSCAAVQSKIGVKPPKRRKGKDTASAWPWAWASEEQEATADPRPQGVCSGRLHQIEHGRLGVIWDSVIFIAFRSSCNWFDCREEKQILVPKVVLLAFLVSFFLHEGRLSCSRSPTVTSQQWLHALSVFFLSCCPSPLSVPHTLPFPSVPPVCCWRSRGRRRAQELAEHLCLPGSISSGLSPARELRPASAFQFVQQCLCSGLFF